MDRQIWSPGTPDQPGKARNEPIDKFSYGIIFAELTFGEVDTVKVCVPGKGDGEQEKDGEGGEGVKQRQGDMERGDKAKKIRS